TSWRRSNACGNVLLQLPDQGGEKRMPRSEKFEVLVLGSGTGGKLLAWHLAQSGHKTAVVERRWVGGSCPNIACMPSKNEISSAKVAHFARHGNGFSHCRYGNSSSTQARDGGTPGCQAPADVSREWRRTDHGQWTFCSAQNS